MLMINRKGNLRCVGQSYCIPWCKMGAHDWVMNALCSAGATCLDMPIEDYNIYQHACWFGYGYYVVLPLELCHGYKA